MFLFPLVCLTIVTATSVLDYQTRSFATSQDDSSSLLQTRLNRIRKKAAKVSTQQFRSIVAPYQSIVANESELNTSVPLDHSAGQLLAYDPIAPVNSELFVFMPGSWVHCSTYTQLLEAIAPRMKTLCFPYDNVESMIENCGMSSNCWYEKRLEALYGSVGGIPHNNLVERLEHALLYLAREDNASWAAFLGPSGPIFSSMRFSGHSQGTGVAAMLGYQESVSRVVQFAGPCDPSDWTETLTSRTPSNRFFGMSSVYDSFCSWKHLVVPTWKREGIVSESSPITLVDSQNLSSFDAKASQTVLTQIFLPLCDNPPLDQIVYCASSQAQHDSVALNTWETGAPYADGLWQELVGV